MDSAIGPGMSTNVTELPRSGRQGAARGAAGFHEAIEAARRAQRRAAIVATGASIAWVVFALVYIAGNGGESELAGLTLPEIAMLAAGIAPGPHIGEALQRTRDAIVDGEIRSQEALVHAIDIAAELAEVRPEFPVNPT